MGDGEQLVSVVVQHDVRSGDASEGFDEHEPLTPRR
jgi:hypothetical protein